MKSLFIIIGSLLLTTACNKSLDQLPPKQLEASSLTDYAGVLNAAYHYQTGTSTPLAVMGDFRADNMMMLEEPFPSFDRFNKDLAGGDLVEQFFRPFYSNLYKSILSANIVIQNSTKSKEIAEAKFLRALSYFKLVMVFGDVTVNLSESPTASDQSILVRTPAADVYTKVIIPDLNDAIAGLAGNTVASGRATVLAARGMLAKVYMYRGDFASAAPLLATVISTATAAGVTFQPLFANVVKDKNSEIIYATQVATSIPDVYGFTEFVGWFRGDDTKSRTPLDPRLTAAFNASSAAGGGTDVRKALTINETNKIGVKYTGGLEQDWIELRLSDVILLYAEALNENGAPATTVLPLLDGIRTRAGLNSLTGTATTKAEVRQAIYNERRLELALEGHRWFDLVRTGTVNAELGLTVDPKYYVFPIPNSEILASNGVITQNPGY